MEPDRPIIGLTIEETKEYIKFTLTSTADLLREGNWELYMSYVRKISLACAKTYIH